MNIEKILNKNANFSCVGWERPCKVKKNCPQIDKRTVAKNVRIGASYDNMAVVKTARENGELPKENQGLFGLEWLKYPYVLVNPKTNKQFLRIETAKNTKFETQYFMNGREVKKTEIENYLLSSEKSKGEIPTVMNIGLDNINYIK